MTDFAVIGVPDSAAAFEYLDGGGDVCFGKYFAKTNTDCIGCRAPVIIENRVALMKEVCAMKCAGEASPIKINKLTSEEVLQRIERGATMAEIFREILGKAPVEFAAAAARQLLVDRLIYLKSLNVNAGPVPRYKEMLKEETK